MPGDWNDELRREVWRQDVLRDANYRRGLLAGMEAAAKLADFYAEENFRLAGDTVLTDPVIGKKIFTPEALATSSRLQIEGCSLSGMAHGAQNVAKAIRDAIAAKAGEAADA